MFGTFTKPAVTGNDSPAEEVKETAIAEEVVETVEDTETESDAVENESEESAEESTVKDDDSEEETDDDAKPEEVKKPKKGFERRIEKFNQKLSAKDQEIEYWKKAALGGAKDEVQPEKTAPTTQTGKPKFEDYNDIEAYTEAVTDWKIEQRFAKTSQEQQAKTVLDGYEVRLTEFKKTTPDFQEVLDDFIEDYGDKQVPEIVQIAFESEVGPQIAYYLAKNTDEVDRIAALQPHRRLIELGKIEDRLSKQVTETKEEVPVETKKISKAPKPIEPVKGNGKVGTKDINDPNLPYEEWVKLRKAQISKR